ncbi:MAG: hypothetical protein ACTSPY_17545 [Candidatus Helarchaeota archaeon]
MDVETERCGLDCGENHKGKIIGKCNICNNDMCEICGDISSGIHKQSGGSGTGTEVLKI